MADNQTKLLLSPCEIARETEFIRFSIHTTFMVKM